MRTLKNGKIDKRVMSMIVRNYDKLKDLCIYRSHGLLCSKSYEDIFHDAILFVSQDKKASLIFSEEELIRYFNYRFRMILYQTINDNKQLKEIPYADYIQTSKKEDSEE